MGGWGGFILFTTQDIKYLITKNISKQQKTTSKMASHIESEDQMKEIGPKVGDVGPQMEPLSPKIHRKEPKMKGKDPENPLELSFEIFM